MAAIRFHTSTQQPSPQAQNGFEKALGRFMDSLSDDEKSNYHTVTTELDVRKLIGKMESQQGRRGSLRNMNRISPFIQAISQYAKVIEVFVQAKPEILAFVWGPLKLLLQISSTYVDAFDKLLDAFESIGECMPRFDRFTTIFACSERMQGVVALVYEDILEFYRRTLKFFQRRAWRILFSLAWLDFQGRFQQILDRIRRHQELIDNEANAEAIEQAQATRAEEKMRLDDQLREALDRRRKDCCEWLAAPDMETFNDDALRKRTPGTAQWLLKTQNMCDYLENKCHIWLNGKPGAGKTVLTSSVIEQLHTHKNAAGQDIPIVYFYCSYKQPGKNTCIAVLCSLIAQLLLQDDSLIRYVHDQYTRHPQKLPLPKCEALLLKLIEAAVPVNDRLSIVVDGLDELPESERKLLLRILKGMLFEKPVCEAVAIFVASQDLPDIRKVLGKKRSRICEIPVAAKNMDDIKRYLEFATDEFLEDHEDDGLTEEFPEIKKTIIDSLYANAQGMFLYVYLVMKGLLSQVNPSQLIATLETLPKGLDQAYERIIDRIEILGNNHKEMTVNVLGWLAVAKRPLTMREIEDAYAISQQKDSSTVSKSQRPLRSQIQQGCGPLIEVIGEDTITFVHDSARRYLLKPQCRELPLITEAGAHRELAAICAKYLNFACFSSDVTTECQVTAIQNGDLRLCNYVQSSWLGHVMEAYYTHDEPLISLNHQLSTFFAKNCRHTVVQLSPKTTTEPKILSKIPDQLKPGIELILSHSYKSASISETMGFEEDKEDPIMFSKAAANLHMLLESMLEDPDPEISVKLYKMYGKNLYKCCWAVCRDNPMSVFHSEAERRRHEEKHQRPYRCCVEGCTLTGHPSKQALTRHKKQYHEQFEFCSKKPMRSKELLDNISTTLLEVSTETNSDLQKLQHEDDYVNNYRYGYVASPPRHFTKNPTMQSRPTIDQPISDTLWSKGPIIDHLYFDDVFPNS